MNSEHTPAAYLVSDNRQDGAQALTAEEYKALRTVLEILRVESTADTLQQAVLSRLLGAHFNGDVNDADQICMAVSDDITDCETVIINGFVSGDHCIVPLSGHENVQAVIDYARLLREDSWFTHWIRLQVSHAVSSNRRLTPADAMISLVGEASQFEADIAITERTLSLYPQLFESKRPAEQPNG